MPTLEEGKTLIHTKEIHEKSQWWKGAWARHLSSHPIDFEAIARVKNWQR